MFGRWTQHVRLFAAADALCLPWKLFRACSQCDECAFEEKLKAAENVRVDKQAKLAHCSAMQASCNSLDVLFVL